MENRELPPIIIFDEFYETEKMDGTGDTEKARFVPTNKYAFLCPNMGERAMAPDLLSRQDIYGEPKPGIYTHTFEKSKSPLKDTTEAVVQAIPIVLNPKKLFARQVYAA
jgi:hypothetical protein